MHRLTLSILIFIVVVFVINGLFLILELAVLGPDGSGDYRDAVFLHTMFLVHVLFIALGSPFGMLSRRIRRQSAFCFVTAIAFLFVSFKVIEISNARRREGFVALAERSRPLIAAIRQYESDKGEAPETLDALVPEYLAAVPGTGLEQAPEYVYRKFPPDNRYVHGNPWIIDLSVSVGMNFDAFYYYPLQNYPDEISGNRYERIGDWAYMHE